MARFRGLLGPEPLPVCDFCGPGMVLIVNGSEQAKHRLLSHTRARHGSWRACVSDALQAARVASEGRGRNELLSCSSQLQRVCSQSTPRPPPAALLFAQLGDASPSAGHPMRTHIVRTPRAGGRARPHTSCGGSYATGSAASHINLRIGTAACCCCSSSSSLLLPHSVKPAAQRGVQNSRGLVPPEAERVQTR